MSARVETPAVTSLFKRRGTKQTHRRKSAAASTEADDGESSGYTTASDADGKQIKRRRKNYAVQASSKDKTHGLPIALDDSTVSAFAGDKTTSIQHVDDATKKSDWYEEHVDRSSSNIKEKSVPERQKIGNQAESRAGLPLDENYHGQAGYQSFVKKSVDAKPKSVGPVKSSTNVRSIVVTDFAPDVCKDYKQTGFCGFGDSCKFLHAREDYKQGWQLDKDWEVSSKGKKATPGTSENSEMTEEDALLEKIPFACIICKQSYRNPIVTKCNHYFCEPCALQRYKKNPTCAACGAGTNGAFNGAKQLKRLLDRKKQREEKRAKDKAIADEEAAKAE